MANEIKNREHAVGTFVPVVAPPFTSPILNSVGVDSFTRNGPGNYTVGLTDAIGFAGAQVRTELPANFLGIVGGQLAPDGASVLVTVFDLSGVAADPPFVGFSVQSVVEGEGVGPSSALPGPPAPPAGASKLLGWAEVDAAGAIQSQSAPAILAGAPALPNPGQYDYTITLATLAAVQVQGQGVGAASQEWVQGAIVTGVSTATVRTFNQLGSPIGRAHWVYFYSA